MCGASDINEGEVINCLPLNCFSHPSPSTAVCDILSVKVEKWHHCVLVLLCLQSAIFASCPDICSDFIFTTDIFQFFSKFFFSRKCIIGIAIYLVHFDIKDTLVPYDISVFYSISVGPAGLMEFKQLSIFALFMHLSHHCVEINLHLSSVRLYNEFFRMRIPANARHFSYWNRHYVPECKDTKCIHWAVSNLTPGKVDDIKCKIYTEY